MCITVFNTTESDNLYVIKAMVMSEEFCEKHDSVYHLNIRGGIIAEVFCKDGTKIAYSKNEVNDYTSHKVAERLKKH